MENVTTTFNSNHLYLSVDGSNRNWNGPGDSGYAVVGMKGRMVYNIHSAPIGVATASDAEIYAMAIALQAAIGVGNGATIFFDCTETQKVVKAVLNPEYRFHFTGDKLILEKVMKVIASLGLIDDKKWEKGLPTSLNGGKIRLVWTNSHVIDHLAPQKASYEQKVEYARMQLERCNPDLYGPWMNFIADQCCKYAARYGAPFPFKK